MSKKQTFRIYEGSLQERFQQSRAKIQIFGGGFANGKTANACIKAIQLSKDYPGANILIARATYPKLNDTIRKEYEKWRPRHWSKSFPKSQNSPNTDTLINETEVNFRYVQQHGKSNESTTSNLLSATYDAIFIDQIDDPEFTFKDFLDLLGRLRGSTPYAGDDPTMPSSGPRWLILTCNPTRNWFFKKIVRPLMSYDKTGHVTSELQQIMDAFNTDTLTGLVELFEGSTYENKDNLDPDYIHLLEAMYSGQMRSRFLLGEWGAYEGLVYPMFDETTHCVNQGWARGYLRDLQGRGYNIEILEGYDHGLVKPSCYLFSFVDPWGNIIVCDGFHVAEQSIEVSIEEVKRIRRSWLQTVDTQQRMFADPAIFRRGAGDKKVVGVTVAELFRDGGNGIRMQRGNNEIINGVMKVQGYLNVHKNHKHPVTGDTPAPYLYIVSELEFFTDEIVDYYWRRDPQGETEDMPMDRNDHAMDTTKYLLSRKPRVSQLLLKASTGEPAYMKWNEQNPPSTNRKEHRYGRTSSTT